MANFGTIGSVAVGVRIDSRNLERDFMRTLQRMQRIADRHRINVGGATVGGGGRRGGLVVGPGINFTFPKEEAQKFRNEFSNINAEFAKGVPGLQKYNTRLGATAVGMTRFAAVAAPTALLVGTVLAAGLGRAGDSYANFAAKLKIATNSQEEFLRAEADVIRVAQETATPLDAIALLYLRLGTASKNFNLNQQELAGVLDVVAKSIQLSGANAAEAQGTIIQFSQALTGNFSAAAQEINTLIEQAPFLAQVIAEGFNRLGITTNASAASLKFLSKEILNTNNVLAALQIQSDVVNEKWRDIPNTIGRATTRLGNAFKLIFGRAGETTGVMATVADSINEIAEIIERPSFQRALNGMAYLLGKIAKLTFEGLDSLEGILSRFEALTSASGATEDVLRNFSPFVAGGPAAALVPAVPRRPAVGGGIEGSQTTQKTRDDVAELIRSLQEELVIRQAGDAQRIKTIALLDAENAARERGIPLTDMELENIEKLAENLQALERELEVNAKLESIRQEKLSKAQQIFESTRTDQEKYNEAVENLNQLYKEGFISQETFERGLQQLQDEFNKTKDEVTELQTAIDDSSTAFKSAFESAIVDGEKLSDVLNQLGNDLFRIALRALALDPIFDSLATSLKGGQTGGGNFVGGLLGSFLGLGGTTAIASGPGPGAGPPIRAGGGSVYRGVGYLVGEGGPELFTPDVSGSIIPNTKLSSLSGSRILSSDIGGAVNASININGARDPAAVANEVIARLNDLGGGITERQTMRNTSRRLIRARGDGL